MEEEKLIQYLKGRPLSEKETGEILDWIESSDANREKYNDLKNLWALTGLAQVKPLQDKKFFSNKNERKTIKLNQANTWLKYAAVFILAFFTGAISLYLTSRNEEPALIGVFNQIEVPNGEKSMVTLYDGTKVWLNSGTTFRYPATFSKQNREVSIEGEAYFDVTKDLEKPFVVHAGQMEVRVFGTRFNVYAYPADDQLFTTLEAGKVSVLVGGSNQNVSMEPGEQFGFSKSSRTAQLVKVNTGLFTSWKDNILRFEDAALSEVLKKMERWYGVKFIIDEKLDTSDRYTMSVKTESLREILNVLSRTTQMKYEIENDVVKIKRP